MDLYVEKQCVDLMKQGELKQFLLLFDTYFVDLYKYVTRRVGEGAEAEEITRITFLDALGQIQSTPTDSGFTVWLYSLAKPRVWERINQASFPQKQGLIGVTEKKNDVDKLDKMMGKLSLEEREILRLKFFEEVSDGDVMTILGVEEGTIGPKIYRVLKRAHFLLFGESDEKQGVYFGELSGFLARARELEAIVVPEAFKLGLKTDLKGRIDRRDLAVEAEDAEVEKMPNDLPFQEKDAPTGSNDPAKIFVEAVREMKEDEERAFERKEAFFDLIDKWKHLLIGAPVVLFLGVVGFVAFSLFGGNDKLARPLATTCGFEVEFDKDFYNGEKRGINKQVTNRVCDHFETESIAYTHVDDRVAAEVEVEGWSLDYNFAKKGDDWRIKSYAKTPNSNEESGEV